METTHYWFQFFSQMFSQFLALNFTLGSIYLKKERKRKKQRIQAEIAGVKEINRVIIGFLSIPDKSVWFLLPSGIEMRSLREVYLAFFIEKYRSWSVRFILVIKLKGFLFVSQIAKTSARTKENCHILTLARYKVFKDVYVFFERDTLSVWTLSSLWQYS